MPKNQNKKVSPVATPGITGGTSVSQCPRCGNGINDLSDHLQQIPSSYTETDVYNKLPYVCLDS